jgi:hypothetical protein
MDSETVADVVVVAAKGAWEAGEKDGGSAASRFSREGRAWYRAMRVFTRGRRWEGGRPTLLSPAKRVLEEVRRWVEGRRYESMEAKQAAVEGVL